MLYNLFLLLSQYEFSYNLSDEKYLNLELEEPFTVKMAEGIIQNTGNTVGVKTIYSQGRIGKQTKLKA